MVIVSFLVAELLNVSSINTYENFEGRSRSAKAKITTSNLNRKINFTLSTANYYVKTPKQW